MFILYAPVFPFPYTTLKLYYRKIAPPPPPMLSSTRACIRVTYYAKDLRDIQKITGLVSLKCFLYMTNTLTVEGQGCNFEKQKKKKEI